MTGTYSATVTAAARFIQSPPAQLIPIAFYEFITALVAPRGIGLWMMHISTVHVTQPLAMGDVSRPQQGVDRGAGFVQHLPVGMEGREVQWHVNAQAFRYPLSHGMQLLVRVIFIRNQERGDFHPHAGFTNQVDQGLLDIFKFGTTQFAVKVLAECLKIHIGRIHVFEKGRSGDVGNIAGSDGDILDVQLPTGPTHIPGIFQKNDRIVVGIGYRTTTISMGRFGDGIGCGLAVQGIHFPGFADVPVLTEFTGQVTTRGAKGQHRRAREKMIQGFFFHRVYAESTGPSPGGENNLVLLPLSHVAQAALSFPQLAITRAQVAAQAPVRHCGPVPGRPGQRIVLLGHDY